MSPEGLNKPLTEIQVQSLMKVTLGRAKEGGSSLGLGGSWLKGDMHSRSVTVTTTPKDESW